MSWPLMALLACLTALVCVLRWGLRQRVIYRNTERPNLVVMHARWGRALLLDSTAKCTACGWKSHQRWSDEESIERYSLPELAKHRCPTLDEASRPPQWERLA